MKKLMTIVAFVAIAMTANAQWFDFSNNSRRLGFGVHLGQNAFGTEYADIAGGLSLNAMGVYIDFTRATPEHQYDNHVTNTLYNDSSSFTINVGYQIPVLPWLRVTPIVGYHQTNYGITDATTVNIETNENTSQMYHDYDVTDGSRKHYFNVGLGLCLTPIKWVDIYGMASLHAIYGGISINLAAFAE